MIKNLLKLIITIAAVFCFVLLLAATLCGDTMAAIVTLFISGGLFIYGGL